MNTTKNNSLGEEAAIKDFPNVPMHLDYEGLIPELPAPLQVNGIFTQAFNAMKESKQIIEDTASKLKGLNSDRSRNTIAKQIVAFEYAQKIQKKIETKNANAEAILRSEVYKIDQDISNAISESAQRHPFAHEARSIVRNKKDGDRMMYVSSAISDGDFEFAEHVLGASTRLTGLKKEDKRLLTEQFKKEKFKERIEYRDHLNNVADSIGKLSGHFAKYVKGLHNRDVERALMTRKDVDDSLKI